MTDYEKEGHMMQHRPDKRALRKEFFDGEEKQKKSNNDDPQTGVTGICINEQEFEERCQEAIERLEDR